MKRISIALLAAALGVSCAVPAAEAQTEKVLYSFCREQYCTDGLGPVAGVIDVKGTLYGTTQFGGAGAANGDGDGEVFSLALKTGTEQVLQSFEGTNGETPLAGLIDVDGTLYGTTEYGGAYNSGTVYAGNTVLYSFCSQQNCTDGAYPEAGLIDVNGTLYGTTDEGGAYGYGTVFSIDPATGAETVLWSFGSGTDGAHSVAGLTEIKGRLYGTTAGGGAYGYGTVFSLDLETGAEAVLWSFGSGSDGAYPVAGVIRIKDTLYGTTSDGGSAAGCPYYGGCGTAFSLDLKTGAETVLHSFGSGTDGVWPLAGLVKDKGTLYGTTDEGGTNYEGTVFSLDPATGTETVVWSFGSGTDGEAPFASLLDVRGMLYGTTILGGTHGAGTVFSIVP